MVFVWSHLTKGEPHFTLSQVALNDTIMVVAFAPIVGFLLGLSAITVPWDTLVLSVVLYIVIPVIIAQLVRRSVLKPADEAALAELLRKLGPLSLVSRCWRRWFFCSVPRRARSRATHDHRAARGADSHSGLFQRRVLPIFSIRSSAKNIASPGRRR